MSVREAAFAGAAECDLGVTGAPGFSPTDIAGAMPNMKGVVWGKSA